MMVESGINLAVCPNCGTEEMPVVSVERVSGYLPIEVAPDDNGWTAAFSGSIEFDWGTSQTLSYCCRCCYQELPEPYQAELDRLLRNERED